MPSNMIASLPTVRLMLAACLAVATPMTNGGIAFAADGQEGASAAVAQPPPPRDRPDFLFGRPRGVVGLTTGWLRASPGGLLDSFRDYLITGVDADDQLVPIGDRAYDTVLFRFVAGFSITPRVDLVFDIAPASRAFASEYGEFTEGDLPIAQTTRVRQVPINVGVRYWLLPRGRQIGRLAWVPSTLAFHVGAGTGTRWYRLEQAGDFVDFADLSIETNQLRSQGWAATRHVSAGASLRLTRQLFAVAEVRRVWSRTVATGNYFGDIDLNGLQMTGGIEFLF